MKQRCTEGMDCKKINISGTGCALADFLYSKISFEGSDFRKFLSKETGDGGLSPGKLVFTEELEKFAGNTYENILKKIIGNRSPDAFNVGGPSLVSLIHASQLLNKNKYEVKFFGISGKDETADRILKIVRNTPLNIENYLSINKISTPFTDVFSDPHYDSGHGERTFINNIGAAWEYYPQQLGDEFFNSHIICLGGTALVPHIHDNLTSILENAKNNNCITFVNTVFDFRNEKNYPGKPWPLGESIQTFDLIDILIMDCEEALKISGHDSIEKAATFFATTNLSSFIITNGANMIFAWSGGKLFKKTDIIRLPVSSKITDILMLNPELKGDTTGCGDNFAGGVIASLAWQLADKPRGQFDLIEAISWGIASGGHTCFIIGGTYLEKTPGEKLLNVKALQEAYIQQIGY